MTTPTPPTATRKVWVACMDTAVLAAQERGGAVDVDKLLDSCGIFSWSPYRSRAREYAETLLADGATP